MEVKCEKTGYYAEIEFLTKPFFGGKPHKIQGGIYKQSIKKPILAIRGEWNGLIYAKPLNGEEYLFLDVKAKPEVRKVSLAEVEEIVLTSVYNFRNVDRLPIRKIVKAENYGDMSLLLCLGIRLMWLLAPRDGSNKDNVTKLKEEQKQDKYTKQYTLKNKEMNGSISMI